MTLWAGDGLYGQDSRPQEDSGKATGVLLCYVMGFAVRHVDNREPVLVSVYFKSTYGRWGIYLRCESYALQPFEGPSIPFTRSNTAARTTSLKDDPPSIHENPNEWILLS